MTRRLTKIPQHVSFRLCIILQEICKLREEFGSFIKRLQLISGLDNKVCCETVRNLLKKKRYRFHHSRKKEY